MTVIAYRDGVLATDSACFINGIRAGTVRKAYEYRGWLFGWCGASGFERTVRAMIDHLEEVDRLEGAAAWPALPAECSVLLVSPAGLVDSVTEHSRWEPISADFLAIGSGCEVAVGAMDQGASAEEAVRAAIRRNAWCGGDVQAVRLSPVAKAIQKYCAGGNWGL